jgi:hypothetical protein
LERAHIPAPAGSETRAITVRSGTVEHVFGLPKRSIGVLAFLPQTLQKQGHSHQVHLLRKRHHEIRNDVSHLSKKDVHYALAVA